MESDGVHESLAETLRTGLMAASRIGEQLARMHENLQRRAEASSAQEQRELQNRLDTERLAARAQLAVVHQDPWWDTADAESVVDAWQTAHAWRTVDPEIERSAVRIQDEVKSRWGLDVNDTGASVADVRMYLAQRLRDLELAGEERKQADRDEREALEILVEADRMQADREAGLVEDVPGEIEKEDALRERADDLFASSSVHAAKANGYEGTADASAHAAKTLADQGQAVDARMATAPVATKAKRPRRPSSGHAQEQTISR